jgi:hypothetical protein
MFKNSKKQGDAGLGQAIAYFTMKGYDVALPLTDSADWDLIVETENGLQRVQVKTSGQFKPSGNEVFSLSVQGGNQSWNGKRKIVSDQNYDLLFLHHLVSGKQLLIPKNIANEVRSSLTLCEKYSQYVVN